MRRGLPIAFPSDGAGALVERDEAVRAMVRTEDDRAQTLRDMGAEVFSVFGARVSKLDLVVFLTALLMLLLVDRGFGLASHRRFHLARAWIVESARAEDVFTQEPDDLWSAVVRRKGPKYRLMATMPLDPSLN